MNILSLLTTDHRNVDALFTEFTLAKPDDLEDLARLRDLILKELAVHAEIEEETLYPALRDRAEDEVLEALEEHHAVKATLAELERMPPSAERFRAKMTVVIESIRHHVEEEEGPDGLFEVARKALKPVEMEAMAERAAQLRVAGPTRPHPWVPDTPPLNVLVGVPVAVLDRVVTTARQVLERTILHKAG